MIHQIFVHIKIYRPSRGFGHSANSNSISLNLTTTFHPIQIAIIRLMFPLSLVVSPSFAVSIVVNVTLVGVFMLRWSVHFLERIIHVHFFSFWTIVMSATRDKALGSSSCPRVRFLMTTRLQHLRNTLPSVNLGANSATWRHSSLGRNLAHDGDCPLRSSPWMTVSRGPPSYRSKPPRKASGFPQSPTMRASGSSRDVHNVRDATYIQCQSSFYRGISCQQPKPWQMFKNKCLFENVACGDNTSARTHHETKMWLWHVLASVTRIRRPGVFASGPTQRERIRKNQDSLCDFFHVSNERGSTTTQHLQKRGSNPCADHTHTHCLRTMSIGRHSAKLKTKPIPLASTCSTSQMSARFDSREPVSAPQRIPPLFDLRLFFSFVPSSTTKNTHFSPAPLSSPTTTPPTLHLTPPTPTSPITLQTTPFSRWSGLERMCIKYCFCRFLLVSLVCSLASSFHPFFLFPCFPFLFLRFCCSRDYAFLPPAVPRLFPCLSIAPGAWFFGSWLPALDPVALPRLLSCSSSLHYLGQQPGFANQQKSVIHLCAPMPSSNHAWVSPIGCGLCFRFVFLQKSQPIVVSKIQCNIQTRPNPSQRHRNQATSTDKKKQRQVVEIATTSSERNDQMTSKAQKVNPAWLGMKGVEKQKTTSVNLL